MGRVLDQAHGQIDKIAGYIRYLQENSQERDLLFKELQAVLEKLVAKRSRKVGGKKQDLPSAAYPSRRRPGPIDSTA